jgi:hypothetical protein
VVAAEVVAVMGVGELVEGELPPKPDGYPWLVHDPDADLGGWDEMVTTHHRMELGRERRRVVVVLTPSEFDHIAEALVLVASAYQQTTGLRRRAAGKRRVLVKLAAAWRAARTGHFANYNSGAYVLVDGVQTRLGDG